MDNFNKNENKAKKHTEPQNNPESNEESSNDIQKEYIPDNGGKAPAELSSASSDIINEVKTYVKPENCPETIAENNSNNVQGHPTKAKEERISIFKSHYEDFSQDDNVDNEANYTYKNKPGSSQNRPLSCTMMVNTDIQQQTEEEWRQMLVKDLYVMSTSKERYSDDNSSAKDEISSNISDNSTVAISDNAEIKEVSNSSSPDISPYIYKSNNIQQNQNDFSDKKPSSSSTFNDDLNSERVTFSDIDDDNVEKEYTRKTNKGPKQTSSFSSHAIFSSDTLPRYINYGKPNISHGVDLSSSTEQSIIMHTPSSSSNNSNNKNASSSIDAFAELPKPASFIIPSSFSHDVVASISETVPLKEVVDTDIDNSIAEEYEYIQMLQIQQDLIRSRKRKPLSVSDVGPSISNTRFDYERPSTSSNIDLSTYTAFSGNLETTTEVDAPSTSSDAKLSSYRKQLQTNVDIVRTTKPFNTYDTSFVSNSSLSDFSPYISNSNNMQQNQNDSSDDKPSSSSIFNDYLNFKRDTFSDIDDDNVEDEQYTRKINKGPKQTSSFSSHANFSCDTLSEHINYGKPSISYGVDLSFPTEQSIILHTPNSSSNNNNNIAFSSVDAFAELPKPASFMIPSSSLHDVVASILETVPLKEVIDTDIDNSIAEEYEYMQMLQIPQDLIRSRKRKPLSVSDVNSSTSNTRFEYERPSASGNINLSTYRFGNLETITEVDAPSTSSDVKLFRTTKPFNTYDSGFIANFSSSDFSPYISNSNNMQQNQNDSSDDKPSSSSIFNDDLNFTFSDIDDDNVEEEEYTQKITKGPKQTSSFASHATFSCDTLPGCTNYGKHSISHGVDLSSSTEQSIILHTPSSSSNNNNASSSIDASFIIPSSSSYDIAASISGAVPLKQVVDTDIDNSIEEEYKYMQMLQVQQDLVRKPLSVSDVSCSISNTRFDYERPSASSNLNLSTYRAFFGSLGLIEVNSPSTSSDVKLSSYRKRLLTNVEIVRTTKPFNTYDSGFVTSNNSNNNNNNQESVEPPTSSGIAPSTPSNKITEKEKYSYSCSSSTTDLSRIPSSNSGNILRYSLDRAPLTPISNNDSASSPSRPSIEGQEENVSSTPSSSKVNNNRASSYEDSAVPANIINLGSNPPPKKLKTRSSSTPSNTKSNDAPSHFPTYFDELQIPKPPIETTEEEEKELERKKSQIRDHMASQRILHLMNLYADLAEQSQSDDEMFVMEDLD